MKFLINIFVWNYSIHIKKKHERSILTYLLIGRYIIRNKHNNDTKNDKIFRKFKQSKQKTKYYLHGQDNKISNYDYFLFVQVKDINDYYKTCFQGVKHLPVMDIQGYRGISGSGCAEGCEHAAPMASTLAADAADAADAAAWW